VRNTRSAVKDREIKTASERTSHQTAGMTGKRVWLHFSVAAFTVAEAFRSTPTHRGSIGEQMRIADNIRIKEK
jgi:hypothetical protein